MKLRGHLSEYPLQELLTILKNRRESGRLQVDFELAPGIFDLKDGKILEATVGTLKGLEAVRVALLLNAATFDFDDTIAIAASASIDGILINDLTDIESTPLPKFSPTRAEKLDQSRTLRAPVTENIPLTAKEALIYVHGRTLAVGVAVILVLLVSIAIAMTVSIASNDGRQGAAVIVPGSDRQRVGPTNAEGGVANHPDRSAPLPVNATPAVQKPIAKPEPAAEPTKPEVRPVSSSSRTAEPGSDKEPAARNDKPFSPKAAPRVVAVVMHIEEGRISEAYVKDHHPGLEAFEATAIRLARQRRYSRDKVGTETIFVKVSADQ